ncbi:MAG: flavodoxin family protein [Pseudobdellovibrionaceae bacterium]
MDNKNILVVYYSRSGNTRKVAEEIAQRIGCDIQEIKSTHAYPMGYRGYQKALLHAAFKKKPTIKLDNSNLSQYDLVIVGGPVWGGTLSPPVRSFLETYKNQIKNVAFFLTQGGTFGRQRLFFQMTEVCGKTPLAFLAVNDSDLHGENYQKRVAWFLRELKLEPVEAKMKSPPENFMSP